MKQEDLIDILRNYKKERANYYGIMTTGIFGSIARGDAHKESDVDIVLRIREPDLFMLAGIKEDLEERLHAISQFRVAPNGHLRPFGQM